ncbi:protein LKAAEAR1 [Phocoena sinus]|uniref:protein LKAAEAR1 n=1 Tax=Phocoena sinus TaxID=42100 RepID=UPI0013C52148|nr:protein LKAAEAR1 [Phocoena sinus]
MASPLQQASCPFDSETPPHTRGAGPKAGCTGSRGAGAGNPRRGRVRPKERAPTGHRLPSAGPEDAARAGEGTARRVPREQAGKGVQGAGARVGCAKAETPTPSWALKPEGLEAIHLLFSDLLEDVGAAASVFPSESAELGHRMPDPRAWTLQLETPAQRQDRVLGVLKAAEARGRVRALRLRYARLRAEELSLLIQRQKSARAALRLELFLPPQLKPTRIPDPLDRRERRRVETILEEKVDGSIFPR